MNSDPIIDSRGGCSPVTQDVDEVLVKKCEPAQGGTVTVGVPEYNLVVTNPSDDVLRDSSGNPVLVDGQVVQKPVA